MRLFAALMVLLAWAMPGLSQRKISLNIGCSYTGEAWQTEINTWESNSDARSALEGIMKFTGLPANFMILEGNVPNALAGIYESTRIIVYNQAFIQKVKYYTNNDWAAISILAHEIGHHLSGHTLDNQGSRPSKELEADLFSGFVLFKMGATLNDATLAVRTIVSENGSYSHPGRSARIAAITKGWMSSQAISAQSEMDMSQQAVSAVNRNASQNDLVKLYSNYSQQAANAYNAGHFKAALEGFKNSLIAFNMMVSKGYISQLFDTTTSLYAGISAEKANEPATAAWYYGQMADRRCKGEGFVEIYKWLADYYKRTGNVLKAVKYLSLGREVYPGDVFWYGFELDIARETGDKDALFNKYEQILKEHPNNHLYLFNYSVELYQAGYDPEITKRPANSERLIAKAEEVMSRVLTIKPDYPNANMVLGQIYYNQGVEYNNKNKNIRSQNGSRLTLEQINSKEALREQTGNKFDQARPYLIKVVNLLDIQGRLSTEDKDNLTNALDLLIIIGEEKINQLEWKKRKAENNHNSFDAQKITSEINVLQTELNRYKQLFNSINSRH
jgi:hypothetical protein